MGFTLYWTEDDIRDAEDEFGTQVARRLERVLERKAQQVRWADGTAAVSRRFHNFFGLDRIHVAEIAFSVQSQEFRAVCLLVAEDALAYFDLVGKSGGQQERLLRRIRENADEIKASIRRRSGQASS